MTHSGKKLGHAVGHQEFCRGEVYPRDYSFILPLRLQQGTCQAAPVQLTESSLSDKGQEQSRTPGKCGCARGYAGLT